MRENWARGGAVVLALALAAWAASYAIDFFVYYHAANVYFHSELPIYGDAAGFVWPMWYRYPPFFLFLVAPLLLLPLRAAAFVWALGKLAVLWGLFRSIRRRMKLDWRWTAVLAAPYFLMELRFGNAQFYVFAFTLLALLNARERPALSGLLLGAAVAIKVWPLFFIPYLIARRDWKPALTALPVAAVLTLAPAIVSGWQDHQADLEIWWSQEFGIAADGGRIWFPSQSLLGVMSRHLTEIDYASLPDPNYPSINWLDLDPETVRSPWLVLASGAYLGLLALAWAKGEDAPLTVHAVAFCSLVLLQPYAQRQIALTVLVFPAAMASSLAAGGANRVLLWSAAALIWIQFLVPIGSLQRLFQVLGLDALAVALLATFLVLRGAAAAR